jgi:hypothetical protein
MRIKKKHLLILIENLLFDNNKKPLLKETLANLTSNALAISYLVSSTPVSQHEKLALHVATFIKANLKKIISSLGIKLSEDQVKLCMLVAYGLTAIESGNAKSLVTGKEGWDTYFIPFLTTDYFETLVSKTGISDTSIGITQLKTGTALSELPQSFRELVRFTGDPAEISGTSFSGNNEAITGESGAHVRSTLLTFGLICLYTQRAIDIGYSFNTPGSPKWPSKVKDTKDYRNSKTLENFKSTGHSALDIAVTAYNFGAKIFTKFGGLEQYKGTHYIPCVGPTCGSGEGKVGSTYIYVSKVTKQMTGAKQRIIDYYDQISLGSIEKSKKIILDKINAKQNREKNVTSSADFPKAGSDAKDFRQWVNDNKLEQLIALYEKEIPHIEDKALSIKSSSNKGIHFWLAFETFGKEWLQSSS